jgi:photosystem II stability/assembly factor-like uncharacterized protein
LIRTPNRPSVAESSRSVQHGPANTRRLDGGFSRPTRGASFERSGLGALFAIAALLAAAPLAAQTVPPDQPARRLEYFRELRSYPFSEIPAGALQAAWRQYRGRWPAAVLLPRPRPGAVGAELTWNPLGPSPIRTQASGRISSVAVHPTDSDVLYIGAAQGGVWKSVDGGASWLALTDRECSLAMGSIVIDPVDAEIVYAGTGELHFSGDSYYGCGVLRSTDGGASWTQLGADVFDTNTVLARIAKVVIDAPTAGSAISTTLYVASSVGVQKSVDSGVTWRRVLNGIATDVIQHPTQPNLLWAAIGSPAGSQSNGIYHSTDGGETWAILPNGFATSNVGRIVLAFAPSTNATLYAAVQDAFGSGGADGTLLGIWRTTDGLNWTQVSATGAECGSQCWYDIVIATDPLDPQTVYFGGIGLYRSNNGGNSFQSILNNIHVDQHAITIDPRDPATLFVGNDGGIYRTRNRGNSWVPLNNNLNITQFYSGISLHPSDTAVVLGGTQDNGTLEFSGTPVWDLVLNGDGGYTAIDYTNPSIAYAETQWQQNSGFSGPRQRIGSGFFSTRKVTGINLGDRALFIPPLVMDPTNPQTLYFGTYRIYRTTNGADLWTAITGDLTRTPNGRISAIAPSVADPATIYVGTSDGHIQVSRDNGTSWLLRNAGFPDRAVTDIAVDAAEAETAIAVVSSFGTGHVFRTTDAGVSWQDISGNLPDVPVNAVLINPALGNDIYIGTDLGTFRTTDLGVQWQPFNDGMPNVAVFDLAYNVDTGLGVAATHGRGMFSFRASRIVHLVVTPDDITFTALADTIQLTAIPLDSTGSTVPASVAWRSLDTDVVTVDADGTVVARGNGTTRVIAQAGGVADTTTVAVNQVAVALLGMPDTTELVLGETLTFDARPVDANGIALEDPVITWTSANISVVAVDAGGDATALAIGTAIVRARLGTLDDSTIVSVLAPATTTVVATAVGGTGIVRSAEGALLPLLTINFAVNGPEAVELVRLGFQLEGNDPDPRLQVIVDEDQDGQVDAAEPIVANTVTTLRPGEPVTIRVSPGGLQVTPADDVSLIIVVRMSGQAPNGATFRASFLPSETSTRNLRSGATNRLQQPASPVESEALRTTVLDDEQLLTLSENPVRSTSLIFNFAELPATAAVYTLNGRLVADLLDFADTEGRGEWDLRNDEGTLVAPGVYLIIFHVRGQVFRERLLLLRRDDER